VLRADAARWELVAIPVDPPVITQHPSAQDVCPGTTVQFSVTAGGQGPLSYRWQKNGVNLNNGGHYAGVTTTALTISNTDGSDVASYRCVVTNDGGSTTSNAAGLTLKAATSITQHPQSQEAALGDDVSFTIQATGEGSPSYQWQKNGLDLNDGGRISGATTATLQIADAADPDAGTYRCVVSAACGDATSNGATLTITGPPTIPGDFDLDDDVDQEDFGHLQECLSGASVPQDRPECQDAKFDGDGDVDENDAIMFWGCMSGANVPGDPGCASN
jgi:hypothetical protein